MHHFGSLRRRVFFLAGATTLAVACAQPVPPPAPSASAPSRAGAVPYHSAFDGYRRFDGVKPQAWQQANDTVRANGGWRAYAREVQQGAPADQASGARAGHHEQGNAR